MNQHLRSYLVKLFAIGNIFPTRMTDKNEIQSLLEKLHPSSCGKELIRLGPKGDGGYLVPDDLAGIEACFSPGVSTISGFEKDCAKLGMQVYLADKSVEQPIDDDALFHFTKKYIGVTTNDDFMTLDNWVAASMPQNNSDLLLQMDIERYEFEVFLAMSDHLMNRFRIIVVEFHELDLLWSKPFFNLASRVLEKILQNHTCVHIHPNNNRGSLENRGLNIPILLEFTFLRNDRVTDSTYQNSFPHPLDSDNTDNPCISLPKCWYNQQ